MSQNKYKLNLGSNLFDQAKYNVSYVIDESTGSKINLFTIENSSQGLVLTMDIRDENANLLAKINKNQYYDPLNKGLFEVKGDIKTEKGLTLIRNEDKTVLFNAKIKGDYVVVSGTFSFGGKKIQITNDAMIIYPENIRLSGNEIYEAGGILIGQCSIWIG